MRTAAIDSALSGRACRWAFVAAVAGACAPPPPPAYEDVRAPDVASIDAAPVDESIAFPEVSLPFDAMQCGGTVRSLTQSRAEIILVIDRSSSMREPGTDGMAKWLELTRSLTDVLPRVQASVAMGVIAYPAQGLTGDPNIVACIAPRTIDVAPAYSNAARVINVLHSSLPSGGTPTNDALLVAAAYFNSVPDATAPRYLVLATDGGPNCNARLNGATCRCTGAAGTCSSGGAYASEDCLDDARTVASLRMLAASGIRTFVIGLAGTASFTDVLGAMAVAGGVPRATTPAYYVATSESQLTAAMNSITSGLVDCRFQLDLAPPDQYQVDVRLGGARIPHDPRHRSGWDWADPPSFTVIEFYGAACTAVREASGGTQLIAAFGCPALEAPP